DTALCNEGVPVALVATPQLVNRLQKYEAQALWNSSQFWGRVLDYVPLPEPIDNDLELVSRALLPECNNRIIHLVVEYAKYPRRKPPLRWIEDLVGDARA